MKKITLITNKNYTVIHFRKKLIEKLLDDGYDVSLIIVEDSSERVNIDNVEIHYIAGGNRSINPFKKISIQKDIEHILNKIKPDIAFTFQLTPNIFGVNACKSCHIKKVYSMVEGIGDVFSFNTLKWKIIRIFVSSLLKSSFSYVNKVFFLNDDDMNTFIQSGIIESSKCIRLNGIGVDSEYYAFSEIKNTTSFLMLARMMPAKGIKEYCEAARIAKKSHPEATFYYAGEEFTMKASDIQEYIDDSSIVYLGYQKDVRKLYDDCFCYVSTSYYREGLPMVLMEASSVGRPSIVLNTIGCKDIIKNGYNGLIVNTRDPKDIASAMIYALEHQKEMIQMGKNARYLVEIVYDQQIINDIIIQSLTK